MPCAPLPRDADHLARADQPFDHACRFTQVLHDVVRTGGRGRLGAVARSHQHRRTLSPPPQLDVRRLVADHERLARVEAPLARGLLQQRRARLAAPAPVGGDVRADVDAAQLDALHRQAVDQPRVDRRQRALGEVAAPHAGLVRDHDQLQAQVSQVPQALGGALDQLDLARIGQVAALNVDRAVAIQYDDTPSRALGHAVLATARHSSSLSHTVSTCARVNPAHVGRLMPERAIASATGNGSLPVASTYGGRVWSGWTNGRVSTPCARNASMTSSRSAASWLTSTENIHHTCLAHGFSAWHIKTPVRPSALRYHPATSWRRASCHCTRSSCARPIAAATLVIR